MTPQLQQVGDLSGPLATVDRRGTVQLGRDPWRIEWGIGAEDRWHVAPDEVAVRQSWLDATPVIETAMRVPGGDVVQRVAGVGGDRRRAVQVEFENRCGTSVTLAVVVRPAGTGSVTSTSISGDRLHVGERAVLVMDRVPGATVAVEADVAWPAIAAGPGEGDVIAASETGTASAAVLAPLLHHQKVRVMLPVEGPPPPFVESETVASGWRAIADRAASVAVADLPVADEWRTHLLAAVMGAGSSELEEVAAAAVVLDRVGLPDEADRARRVLLGEVDRGRRLDPTVARRAAEALASRRLRAGRDSGLTDHLSQLVHDARPALDAVSISFVADAVAVDDPRAADDLRELTGPQPEPRIEGLDGWLESIVTEGSDRLILLPAPPPDWAGRSIDVRGILTRHGLLSYSVRWHGENPALLWQVEGDGQLVVECGLHDEWSTGERHGEALLA